jgi:heat shock transcription factor
MQNPVPTYSNGRPAPDLSNDEFFQWGQTGQPAASYNDDSFAMNANAYPQSNPQPSNQLTRRPVAQLAAVTRPNEDNNAWIDTTNGGANAIDADWGDDIANLEARAQIAKRDAQAKRKQIPPFVQKLNR